jgi:hypothetical protein
MCEEGDVMCLIDSFLASFNLANNTKIIYSILEVLTYPPCPATFTITFREFFDSSYLFFPFE